MSNRITEPEVLTEGPLVEAVRAALEDDGVTEITEAFIVGDNDDSKLLTELELVREVLGRSMSGFDSGDIHKEVNNTGLIDVAKSLEVGSTQNDGEIGASIYQTPKVVEPPYPPELLAAFLQVDETHFRCVKTKVTDAVGRSFILDPVTKPDGTPYVPNADDTADQTQITKETQVIRNFIESSNDPIGFEGVLERASMDFESIGWAAIEVVRNKEMKICKVAHVPATRVKALRGFVGYVECAGAGKYIYYQPFGQKVLSKKERGPNNNRVPYDPRVDGELGAGSAEWQFVDRETGKPGGSFERSANEILWIPKHHCSTIYYGYTDVIPALGHLLANVHIRDYLLQFFEHNTIPRYAIVISGGKLANDVRESIMQFFNQHIKGKAHKTLIIPIPATKGEVKIEFEKLAADVTEGSFQETRKNNQQGIMTAHGVSPAIIGVNDAASLGSGKGLSQAEIYKDRIITPMQRKWGWCLNKLFRLGLGVQMVALKFNPLDIRDLEAEMKIYSGYLERGCITINGVVKKVGLGDPIEGGDRAFVLVPGQGVFFVDEMTEAMSTHIEDMEQQVTDAQAELKARAAEDMAKKAAAAGKGAIGGKPKPPAGLKK